MNPKNVPVKSRYLYNEVSVDFLLIYTNKGGTAIHKPRPFMGLGFFCVLKNKGGIHDAGTFTRTASRSVAKS